MITTVLSILMVGVGSLGISWLLIPQIIAFTQKRGLLDHPEARSAHQSAIPTLGGLAIFAGTLLPSAGLVDDWSLFGPLFLALTLLVAMGLWDDLKDLSPGLKFGLQFLLASGMFAAGIRIESLAGLFGIEVLPLPLQFALTVITIVGVTNAFNLIDGINGLAGGIASMNALTIGTLFLAQGAVSHGLIAIALAGATLGFLRYNFGRASIFMGDTGSLFIGFLLSCLGIQYLQLAGAPKAAELTPVFGILLLPVFDTLRVFAVRAMRGKSPVRPDKNHLHHLFLKTGLSHRKAALHLLVGNAILIGCALMLAQSQVPLWQQLILLAILALLAAEVPALKKTLQLRLRIKTLLSNRQHRRQYNYLIHRTTPTK